MVLLELVAAAPLKLQKKCSGNHNIRRVVHIVHQHLSSACFISMCHPDSNHDLSFKKTNATVVVVDTTHLTPHIPLPPLNLSLSHSLNGP